MSLEKTVMLQNKGAQAANFAMQCVGKLGDKQAPWGEYKERIREACEYQRQAKFLSACARKEMGGE